MSDRVFFPAAALAALLMIVLAALWPQGFGARSPWPFGQTAYWQTPAGRAVLSREAERSRAPTPTAAAVAGLRPGQ